VADNARLKEEKDEKKITESDYFYFKSAVAFDTAGCGSGSNLLS